MPLHVSSIVKSLAVMILASKCMLIITPKIFIYHLSLITFPNYLELAGIKHRANGRKISTLNEVA